MIRLAWSGSLVARGTVGSQTRQFAADDQASGRLVEPFRGGRQASRSPLYDTFFARSLRIDSPRKTILWAVCTMRSSSASASEGSPSTT